MQRSSSSTADLAALRELLNQDWAWAAYALADLQPDFAPHCQWYTTDEGGDDGRDAGVLLLFHALSPSILLTVGPAKAVGALLDEAELPAQVFISALPAHLPLIERYYRFEDASGGSTLHQMYRMAFRHPEMLTNVALADVERLGPKDVPAIEALIAHGGPFAPDAFDGYQLEDGVFFGLRVATDDGTGELVAVGGTHIVDWQEGVGAIGNMYTHPAHRGKGYARMVLGAIVQTLQQGGATNIVLNVNCQNQTALRIYEQYGFAVHCDFVEGIGVKRQI